MDANFLFHMIFRPMNEYGIVPSYIEIIWHTSLIFMILFNSDWAIWSEIVRSVWYFEFRFYTGYWMPCLFWSFCYSLL